MTEPDYERQREAAAADSHARHGAPSCKLPNFPRHEPSKEEAASQSESMGRLVDFFARINASVSVKLLGGFLAQR